MNGLSGWTAVETHAPDCTVTFPMALEAELCFTELALELAYQAECEAFVRGELAEVPDPAAYGLGEALARRIAVDAYKAEVAATAAAFDAAMAATDCDPMADTVREPRFRKTG